MSCRCDMRYSCVTHHSDVSDHDNNSTSDGEEDKLPTTQEQHKPIISAQPFSILSPQQTYKDPLPERPSNRPTIKRRWRESITLPPWWDS